MTAHTLDVVRRKRRRTHLVLDVHTAPLCGTRTALTDAERTSLDLIGGATLRLKRDLMRELDTNACIPCTRIAIGMLALYASRDHGKAF